MKQETHVVTWIVESGEERCYLTTEDDAWHIVMVSLRMGYYFTMTPFSAWRKP